MRIATHALALVAGCAIGYLVMGCAFAKLAWRTCENTHEGKGFRCSNCGSGTDYEPKADFRFCPMCGAFCKKEERI